VKQIRRVLIDHGVAGLRDLALFTVAIDSMLQGPQLLGLTVKDVQRPDGTIRLVIEVERPRGKHARRAPQRVGPAHTADQITDLCFDFGSSPTA
jgi:hypothetical protein